MMQQLSLYLIQQNIRISLCTAIRYVLYFERKNFELSPAVNSRTEYIFNIKQKQKSYKIFFPGQSQKNLIEKIFLYVLKLSIKYERRSVDLLLEQTIGKEHFQVFLKVQNIIDCMNRSMSSEPRKNKVKHSQINLFRLSLNKRISNINKL